MKQGPKEEAKQPATEEELKKVIVETIDLGDGAVAGNLAATSEDIQVIQASEGSEIAGSTAEFPPGTIAIDTQITLGPGVSIATPTTLDSLALDPEIAAAAPSVAISSSVALDTSGFTMQIPVPSQSGLSLQDMLQNLIVIYKVKKIGEGVEVSGILPRSRLELVGGYVRFTTTFFGTFQAIITKTLVEEAKEVVVKPEPKVRKVYFAKGFRTTTFGNDEPKEDGFVSLFQPFSRAAVKADAESKLSTGLLIKRTQEVTEP